MKKSLLIFMIVTLALADGFHYVYADDFSGNEDHYLELCSSTVLTKSKKSVCVKFNTYLKNKNNQLTSQLLEKQNDIENSKETLKSLKKKINKMTDQIESLQKEIDYIQSSISQLEKQISKKDSLIRKRLYSMQSLYNSDAYALYVFKSSSLTDIFSRLASVTQLTSYEEDLTAQINEQKKELTKQKQNLTASQAALTLQKQDTKKLEDQLITQMAQKEVDLKKMNEQKKSAALAQAKVDAALNSLIDDNTTGTTTYSGSIGQGSETGKEIAKIALSKLGARYWWTKTGPNYFDCSGFVYWVHNKAGIDIARLSAAGYANLGTAVSEASLSAGDIITFSYGSGVAHVGIYLGNGKFIHASGRGSATVGQDPQQCVKVSDLSGRWKSYVYNYRRLY